LGFGAIASSPIKLDALAMGVAAFVPQFQRKLAGSRKTDTSGEPRRFAA
jgi:hypothetical protein